MTDPGLAATLPDVAETERVLGERRPDLLSAYRAAVPAARGAVLARLWTALCREPVPGVVSRGHRDGAVTVLFADGRELTGPADAAGPFAEVTSRLVLRLAGQGYDDPAALTAALAPVLGGAGAARFAAELANSVANLALARAGQVSARGGWVRRRADDAVAAGSDLVEWESRVVDGHPLHPGCRTRAGMSPLEVLAYAPEHRPTVRLPLVAVPADRWLSVGAELPAVLPMHPWQFEHVLGAHPGLRDTGRRLSARPLMSLRTVAPLGEPGRHLKTAVDVRMTSAVRTVSPAAVFNGPPVTAFLAGLAEQVGLSGSVVAGGRGGGLTVLRETSAGAVLVDGEPCRSLAVVVRQAPLPRAGEVVLPLSALVAPGPAGGPPAVVEAVVAGYRGDPVAFLADLAGLLLRTTLTLLRFGVAVEAHGQNALVALRGGRPVRLLYRDVGGVRISPARLRRHGLPPPPLRGDLAQDDPRVLRDTLFGALGTALGEQVAVLRRVHQVEPGRLWGAVARQAREVAAGWPGDAAADVAALFGATWPVKATTAMRLAADPLRVVWARQPNPLWESG